MIIIKNGALVTPQGLRRADLAMDGDKIARIAGGTWNWTPPPGRYTRPESRWS